MTPELNPQSRSPDVSAHDILQALDEQRQAQARTEARKAVRHYYCVPLVVQVQDPRTGAMRQLQVATNNISTGGFGFIFDGSVPIGHYIRAQFLSLPRKPTITGIVRSCVRLCGMQHRVGVEFISGQPMPAPPP